MAAAGREHPRTLLREGARSAGAAAAEPSWTTAVNQQRASATTAKPVDALDVLSGPGCRDGPTVSGDCHAPGPLTVNPQTGRQHP
jgi:hypothetical protein